MRRAGLLGIVSALALAAASPVALAQSNLGTAFTYQGRLTLSGSPITGTADLQFTLYDDPNAGNQIGGVATLNGQSLVNGLFTANVDFGAAAFNGQARWMEIAVVSPAGGGAFTTLSPRQALTATPYALQTRGIFVNADNWVGIGTTAPAGFLDVAAPGGAGIPIFLRSGSGRDPGYPTPPTPGGTISLLAGKGGVGLFPFYGSQSGGDVLVNAGSGGDGSPDVNGGKGGTVILRPGTGGAGGPFGTSSPGPSGVVWVDGLLGVNTSTPANPLSVAGNANVTGKVGVGTSSPQTVLHVKGEAGLVNLEGTDHAYIQFYPFGFASGRKAYIGTPGANSTGFNVGNEISGGTLNLIGANVQVIGNFINTSDVRYKHDVRDIGNALSLVDRLHGVRYRWDDRLPDGTLLPDGEQIGFLAQEVEKVLPELVKTDGSGKKGVSYVSVVPLLTEAIKQQQKQLDAKQGEIDALKSRLAALEARMARVSEARSVVQAANP